MRTSLRAGSLDYFRRRSRGPRAGFAGEGNGAEKSHFSALQKGGGETFS